jgi:hypothetical protein
MSGTEVSWRTSDTAGPIRPSLAIEHHTLRGFDTPLPISAFMKPRFASSDTPVDSNIV